MNLSLFAERSAWRDLHKDTQDHISFCENLLPQAATWGFFYMLLNDVPWRLESMRIRDTAIDGSGEVAIPRLQQLYGDQGSYGYSGIRLAALPWKECPVLLPIKHEVEEATKTTFNAVFLNLYRDGSDYVGFHSDDEDDLVPGSPIASYSLGTARDFLLVRNNNYFIDSSSPLLSLQPLGNLTIRIRLQHNTLLLMAGQVQRHWQHSILKAETVKEPRINLTFRVLR